MGAPPLVSAWTWRALQVRLYTPRWQAQLRRSAMHPPAAQHHVGCDMMAGPAPMHSTETRLSVQAHETIRKRYAYIASVPAHDLAPAGPVADATGVTGTKRTPGPGNTPARHPEGRQV